MCQLNFKLCSEFIRFRCSWNLLFARRNEVECLSLIVTGLPDILNATWFNILTVLTHFKGPFYSGKLVKFDKLLSHFSHLICVRELNTLPSPLEWRCHWKSVECTLLSRVNRMPLSDGIVERKCKMGGISHGTTCLCIFVGTLYSTNPTSYQTRIPMYHWYNDEFDLNDIWYYWILSDVFVSPKELVSMLCTMCDDWKIVECAPQTHSEMIVTHPFGSSTSCFKWSWNTFGCWFFGE